MFEFKYRIENDRIVKKSDGIPIPEKEPLFIFRAQDRKALAALVAYNTILDNLEQREQVMKTVNAFRQFAQDHPEQMKEPDP